MPAIRGTRRALLREYPLLQFGAAIDSSSDFYIEFEYVHQSGNFAIGLYADAFASGNPYAAINPNTTQMRLQIGATVIDTDDLTAGARYHVVIEKDDDFIYWRIKGGTQYATWHELYRDGTITLSDPCYFAFDNTDAIVKFSFARTAAISYSYNTSITRYAAFRTSGAITFDPAITTSAGTAIWYWGDGTTTTSNAPTKNYAGAGQRIARMTGIANSAVLTLTVSDDELVGDLNNFMGLPYTAITSIAANTNTGLTGTFALADLPASMEELRLYNTSCVITGALADLPASMTYLNIYITSSVITGGLADLPASMTYLHLYSTNSVITGTLADLPASMTYLHLGNTSSVIMGGLVAIGAIALATFKSPGCGLSQAQIDDIALRVYTDRALFAGTLTGDVGGSNAAPSGVYQDGDPPSTGKEYFYEVENDPEGEGFNKQVWTFTA